MSGITFPAPPHTNGDTHIAENGVIYTWQDGGWMANQVSGLDDTYVNRKGDDMTGDLTVPSLNGGPLAGFRNQIINGDFRIWQRETSFTSTRDTYTADRWFANTPDLSTVDVTRLTGTPEGFYYSLRTSTDTTSLKQGIELAKQNENNQFYIGSVWTFSFWTLGTAGNARLRFRRTVGSASGSVDATDTVAMSEIETSGTWKRYSATLTITGDATASSGITVLEVSVNAPNGGGAVAYTGVQLEPGPVATPFEHRPIQTELALCQRYYQKIKFGNVVFNRNSSSSVATITTSAYAEIRSGSPTVTSLNGSTLVYHNGGRYEGNAANNTGSEITSAGILNGRAALNIARINNDNVFNVGTVGGTSADSTFAFDAEL